MAANGLGKAKRAYHLKDDDLGVAVGMARMRLCPPYALALKTAGNPHGPWRLADSAALTMALPNVFFASLGLPSVAVRRTA
jgi:hypothetical protein